MKKNFIFLSGIAGILIGFLMLFKPPSYQAEATFFVPLTMMEKQINQNGIGFGSPIEIDAHIEILNSNILNQKIENVYGEKLDFDISRTRNGAVKVQVNAPEAIMAANAANMIIQWGDSIKEKMLRQNIEQSIGFIRSNLLRLSNETKSLRQSLDSLRIEAQKDSLALVATIFQKENQFGTAVKELTTLQRKNKTLESYKKVPTPKSYIISNAQVPLSPSELPFWLYGLLGSFLAYIALWGFSNIKT
jgi:hypothetical protein